MSASPLITIGLPVFNGERFVDQAIESILAQTFSEFRLVVSDNASTDRTVEIVRDFAKRDHRIELMTNSVNRGGAWNFNRVFAESRSPYFRWAAADDMLAPTLLERSIDVLESTKEDVVLVYPQTLLVDESGEVLELVEENLAAPPGAAPHTRLLKVFRNMFYGNAVFSVLRSNALRRTRLHGGFPSADYVLLAELALAGEFREVPQPLFLRRLHEGTSWRANPTAESLSQWLDPQKTPVKRRQLTLFREHLRGIHSAQLPASEKALVYLSYIEAAARGPLRNWAGPRTRLRRAWAKMSSLPMGGERGGSERASAESVDS